MEFVGKPPRNFGIADHVRSNAIFLDDRPNLRAIDNGEFAAGIRVRPAEPVGKVLPQLAESVARSQEIENRNAFYFGLRKSFGHARGESMVIGLLRANDGNKDEREKGGKQDTLPGARPR